MNFGKLGYRFSSSSTDGSQWPPNNYPFSGFTGGNTILTQNASVAPDGTTTAASFVFNATGSTFYEQNTAATLVLAQSYTFSVYAQKYATSPNQYVWLDCYDGTADHGTMFDLTNGVVVGNRTGTTVTSSSITPVGSAGWYLVSLVFTALGTGSPSALGVGLSTSGSLTFSSGGVVGQGVNLWRVQIY